MREVLLGDTAASTGEDASFWNAEARALAIVACVLVRPKLTLLAG
jgi:hypothetical protein